jgi:hypothetical protein
MSPAGYNNNVFVNCPFDAEYTHLLRVIVFTVYRCGFIPQTALGEDDGTVNRLDKIIRIIENCKYGIHDISRIELNPAGLPRFNMPFELGIFFGAKKLGSKAQKAKNALVFEREKFSYQQYISDLNGIDTKAHNNDPDNLIRQIRNWLSAASKRTTVPGHIIISKEYKEFSAHLPKIVALAGLEMNDIPFNDYCQIVEEAVKAKL